MIDMSLTSIRGTMIVGAVLVGLLALAGAGNLCAQEQPSRAANLAAARAAFDELPENERKAVQDALIWAGQYSGVPDGSFGRQTYDAVAAYQQSRRKTPTGSLDVAERAELQAAAQRSKAAAGFTMLDDEKTGARIGVPTKVLSKTDVNPSGGMRWQSQDGTVTLDTRTGPPNATLQTLYDRNLAIQAVGRNVTYKVLRPNFMVIAGETGTGKFYTRYDSGDVGIRGFSIGYDKASAPQVDRLVVAIANSFEPFGSPPAAAATQQPSVAPSVQPSPTAGRWLIGTGIALASRRVLTTIPPGTCRDMKVGGVSASLPAQPVTGPWTLVDLPADLPVTISPIATSPAKADDAVIVLSFGGDDPRALTVVAGVMSDERSLSAPLQQEAGGSPVVNSANQLVGILEPVSGNLQKVAGIMPTRAHAIVPVNAFSSLLQPALADRKPIAGTAAIAAFWKPVLIPITCAP